MIKSLQSLRLLGIITIVAGHAGLMLWGGGDWCSFFFILSGFLYKTDAGSLKDYGSYILRKAKSIYPVYWFCLFCYILLAYIRGCEEQYAIGWDFIPHLALVQSWVPGVEPMAYLGPAWFLSSLLFCYCLSPVVKKLISATWWSILPVIVLYFLWARIFCFNSYVSPFYRLIEYAFGMYLSMYVAKRRTMREVFPGFCLAAVLLTLCLIRLGIPSWSEILLFGAIISVLAVFSEGFSAAVLGNKYIVNLAKADIFIYLTHPGIAFHVVMFVVGHNVWAMVLGSVLIGYVMFWLYNALRRISERKISQCLND